MLGVGLTLTCPALVLSEFQFGQSCCPSRWIEE